MNGRSGTGRASRAKGRNAILVSAPQRFRLKVAFPPRRGASSSLTNVGGPHERATCRPRQCAVRTSPA
eukprot:2895399-Pyramimonas_sp.AAC.1